MSRKIDLSEPLSDEDRAYLVERDRWRDLALADGHEDIDRAKREATEANDITQGRRPPTLVGEAARVQAANAEPSPPADPLADLPYDRWTYKALQEEVKVRLQLALSDGMPEVEAREKFKAGGKAAELVKILEDDDEENAE
jgi:hypothetical protein